MIIMVEYKSLSLEEKKNIVEKLNLPEDVLNKVKEYEEKIGKVAPNTSPQVKFATALYLSAVMMKSWRSKREIANLVGITEQSMTICKNKIFKRGSE
jgi:transcription initiation factor TFIIIB Brf1 subunit/transcription initiation factor TFIIB